MTEITAAETIRALAAVAERWADPDYAPRAEAVEATLGLDGGSFTYESITFAVNQTAAAMTAQALAAWHAGRASAEPLTVGVLHAGNVPFGEVQDFAAVLLAGHAYVGAVSSKSPHLLPAFARSVREEAPGLDVTFTNLDGLFARAHAVLATGSDETRDLIQKRSEAAGIPPDLRLLRGHRYGAAVIDGRESPDERERLAEDVILHEGFGCRNVAVVWAPRGLDADPYFEAFAHARAVYPAPASTPARLKLPAAFLRATKQPHAALDGDGLLVSRGAPEPQTPGHLRWTEYDDVSEAHRWIAANANHLQLVAARAGLLPALPAAVAPVALGDTQRPPLDWRPDGVDTLGWLAGL